MKNSRSKVRQLARSDFVKSLPLWLVPVVLVGGFIYGAIIWNFLISLTDYRGFESPTFTNMDFEMYRRALADSHFHLVTRNTFILLIGFTIICLVMGLGLAILLDQDIRHRGKLRTAYLLPFSLAFIVTGQVWLWMYNYNYGVVNSFTRAFGLGEYHIISSSRLLMPAIIFALGWQYVGYTAVVYLAGLRSIPDEQFEAARVGGVKTYRIYLRVILPQLKASAMAAAVVLMVFGLKTFDFLFAMFGSYRPRDSADILSTMMVREAFQHLEWAYGAAIAVLMFLLALVIVSPYIYYQYKEGSL